MVEFLAGARFRGYLPVPALAAAVELIWIVEGMPTVAADRVLPNGVVELIINLGAPHRVVHGRGFTRHRRAWVAGMQQGPLDIASERETHLVGIRFRPGGAARVLAMPLAELTDRVVELEHLGPALCARLGDLRERLALTAGDERRLALVEGALLEISARHGPPDPRVALAVRALRAGGEGMSVKALAAQLGTSHKHLITLFQRDVGVGPKMLGRILRFQGLLAALESNAVTDGPPPRLTDLAYQHGYADQAHLSNEFRALTGIAPSVYHRARTVDPNHLLGGEALGAEPRSPRLTVDGR